MQTAFKFWEFMGVFVNCEESFENEKIHADM